MLRYLVTIDGHEYDIEMEYRAEGFDVSLNGKKRKVIQYKLGESRSLLLVDGQSHEVDVRGGCLDSSKIIFMQGQEIPGHYNLAQLRKTAGMTTTAAIDRTITAPMPGLVVEVKVAKGDSVTKGQPLLVIEAMKMENIIKAQGDGTVKEIYVEAGRSVEKADKMLEFE
jgi:acetyl/propionyl-CoA carboxylase alpha subunit